MLILKFVSSLFYKKSTNFHTIITKVKICFQPFGQKWLKNASFFRANSVIFGAKFLNSVQKFIGMEESGPPKTEAQTTNFVLKNALKMALKNGQKSSKNASKNRTFIFSFSKGPHKMSSSTYSNVYPLCPFLHPLRAKYTHDLFPLMAFAASL